MNPDCQKSVEGKKKSVNKMGERFTKLVPKCKVYIFKVSFVICLKTHSSDFFSGRYSTLTQTFCYVRPKPKALLCHIDVNNLLPVFWDKTFQLKFSKID